MELKTKQSAVFLDRDSVINQNPPWVNKADDLILLPKVEEALKWLERMGFGIHVVTNQGGIGLGHFSEQDMRLINYRTFELLPMIRSIEYCPHRPNDGCECRKPKGGLITRVLEQYKYVPKRCWMIGDLPTDVQAGINAGLLPERCIKITPNTTGLWDATVIIYMVTRRNQEKNRRGRKK